MADPAWEERRDRRLTDENGVCVYCEDVTEDKRADGEWAHKDCCCDDCHEHDCICNEGAN